MPLNPTFNPLKLGSKPDDLVKPLNDFMKSAVGVLRTVPTRHLAVIKFKTPATATAAFPLDVTLPQGMVPRSVVVGRVIDWRSPETAITSAYFVDWRPSGGGLRVRNIVGVSSNSTYEITLEVTGE